MASVSRKGAAPTSPGDAVSSVTRLRQSAIGAPAAAVSVACADRLSSRFLSSPSKPFMTESTVISASTPMATPPSDTQVMNDTKKLCSRAREYRRPTKTGTG
jgi:hypothetical protein